MKLDDEEARRRFAASRVARLATVDAAGRPHLVPVVFAVVRDTVYTAVDAKPKTTTALRRLENVRVNPRVSLLADHYDDTDWRALWWVRADGVGRVLAADAAEAGRAVDELASLYPQYREHRPCGPVLALDIRAWSGWSAAALARRGRSARS